MNIIINILWYDSVRFVVYITDISLNHNNSMTVGCGIEIEK